MRPARTFALVAALVAAGCANAPIDVQLRVPAGDHPLAGADHVAVSVFDDAGATLAFARSAAGTDALKLAPVPAGTGYSIEVDATYGGDVIARGRSCSFDVTAGKPPTVPVWFSRVGRFATTSGPTLGRDMSTAFTWGAGGLVAGGTNDGTALASTEAYDPVAGAFAAGPPLATPRSGARAVALDGGVVLVIGGAEKGAPALEALSAAHTTPEPAGLSPDVVGHAAARASDGSVVIVGGIVGGVATADAWIVTDGGATVDELSPMLHARAGASVVSVSDDSFAPLLIVGGVDATSASVASVETFDPASQSFADSGIALVTARSGQTVTRLATGLLLVVGGVDATGTPIAGAELIDPVNRAARAVAMLRVARTRHDATLLSDGRVLVSGGIGADGSALADVEIFDPSVGPEGDFVPTAPLETPRADHALVPLCDRTYLVVGGGSGAEIYNPL